jgi:hypothetical protein
VDWLNEVSRFIKMSKGLTVPSCEPKYLSTVASSKGFDYQSIRWFVENNRSYIKLNLDCIDFSLDLFNELEWDNSFHRFLSEYLMRTEINVYRTVVLILMVLKDQDIEVGSVQMLNSIDYVARMLEGDSFFSSDVPKILFALGY